MQRFPCAAGFFVPPDERPAMVYAGSEDGAVYLWDLQTQRLAIKYEGHQGACVRARGLEARLLTLAAPGCPPRSRSPGRADTAVAVDIRGDGNQLASGALEKDRTVRVWERAEL